MDYLRNNFSSLSLEQKIEVKNAGTPKPEINLTQTTKGKSRDFIRKFKNEIYEKKFIEGIPNLMRLLLINFLQLRTEEWTLRLSTIV